MVVFLYLRDPLFIFSVVVYLANRWLLKPHLPDSFFSNHLNDLICIPFWVPVMLWIMRKLHLRSDDAPPRSYEIIIPLLLWSAVFEVWLPHTELFRGLATADHRDVLFYTLGALIAAVLWRGSYRGPQEAMR